MSAPTKKVVELFYDVVSPYSWIAFEALCRYRTKWQMDLQFKPMFLGAVMQNSGNKPPATVPNKAVYMAEDLTRLKQLYQIPINQPADFRASVFEKGSLQAQRFVTAVNTKHPKLTEALSRELWMRIWSHDEDITKPESLLEAGRKAGLSEEEAAVMIKLAKDDSIKETLKKVTQEALDIGAFGAPTMLVHDAKGKRHMVFGSDRMEVIAMLLNEKYVGPLKELAAQSKL